MWAVAGLLALIAMLSIAVLDRPVARWTGTLPQGETIWRQGTALLDFVAFKEITNFLLGPVILLAGGVLLVLAATRALGWMLVYVGAVQFASTIVADLAKPPLGRARPDEAMALPGGIDTWFVGANSFPSGHTAFYAGLFFPLILILPRWTLLWLIPPLFVAAARVMTNDHYVSDVAASLALAALMTAAFSFILNRADAAG